MDPSSEIGSPTTTTATSRSAATAAMAAWSWASDPVRSRTSSGVAMRPSESLSASPTLRVPRSTPNARTYPTVPLRDAAAWEGWAVPVASDSCVTSLSWE